MFGCNNDCLFPEKYTVKDHISNSKLEKGDHYYIQTWHKDIFSHYNLTLRKPLKKCPEKNKRNVLMPPGHPIILFNPFAPEPPVTARADPGPFYPL